MGFRVRVRVGVESMMRTAQPARVAYVAVHHVPGKRGAATARGALGWYRPSVGVSRDVGC